MSPPSAIKWCATVPNGTFIYHFSWRRRGKDAHDKCRSQLAHIVAVAINNTLDAALFSVCERIKFIWKKCACVHDLCDSSNETVACEPGLKCYINVKTDRK